MNELIRMNEIFLAPNSKADQRPPEKAAVFVVIFILVHYLCIKFVLEEVGRVVVVVVVGGG